MTITKHNRKMTYIFSGKPSLHLLAAFLFAAILWPVWSLDFLPFQDYYEWVIQSKILFELWRDNQFIQSLYNYSFSPVPPPNTVLVASMAALQFIFSADTAGRILLTFSLFLFVYGFHRFVTMNDRRHPLRYWGLALVYSCFVYYGFMSFFLGMAVLLIFLPVFTPELETNSKKLFRVFLASLLLYFIHGFVFCLFLLLLGTWLLHHLWLSYRKPAPEITPNNIPVQVIPYYILAVSPSLILLFIYALNLPSESGTSFEYYHSVLHLAQAIRYAITPFPRMAFTETIFPLSALNLIFILAVALVYRYSLGNFRKSSYLTPFLVICTSIMLFNPVYRVGDFFPVNPRFFPLILILTSGLLVFNKHRLKLEGLVLGFAAFLAIAHFCILRDFGTQSDSIVVEMVSEYRSSDSLLFLGKAYWEDLDKTPRNIISGIIQPYIRTGFYFHKDSLNTFLKIMPNSIIKMRRNPETGVKITIDSLFDAASTRSAATATARENRFLIRSAYNRVLVLGSSATRRDIAAALQPVFTITGDFPRWTLLEAK